MFEPSYGGAKLRAVQGSVRTRDDMQAGYVYTPEDPSANKMLVLRYVGPDREAVIAKVSLQWGGDGGGDGGACAQVQAYIKYMNTHRKKIKFPSYVGLYTRAAVGPPAHTP